MTSIVYNLPLTTIYTWHGIWDDSFHTCLTASPYSVNVIPSLIIDYINHLSYFPTKITTVHAKLPQSCPALCDLMNKACQAPLSIGFSRHEYWSGLPWPPLGDLPSPGIESITSPALAGGFFTTQATMGLIKQWYKSVNSDSEDKKGV